MLVPVLAAGVVMAAVVAEPVVSVAEEARAQCLEVVGVVRVDVGVGR